MLLDLEKVYVIIQVVADPVNYNVKVEITADEIKNWLRRTGRKINKKWRIRDYLRENYKAYTTEKPFEYDYSENDHAIDYVYRVHSVPHIAHLLVRQEYGGTTFVVKTEDGRVIKTCSAGLTYDLCKNPE